MPGFMDGEGAKARQVAVRKILDDKQFGEDPGKNWSESESSDDDNGKDAPMSSGSSNNVSVEESTAPSDIGSQESGDVESGDVESGDIVFAKEIREATFGGGGAGRKKNHGKRKASAGGSAVGNMNSTKASLGASAKKARGKALGRTSAEEDMRAPQDPEDVEGGRQACPGAGPPISRRQHEPAISVL
ncbi:unnamed protein product [Ectocarpus sp. 6 AP-2014]